MTSAQLEPSYQALKGLLLAMAEERDLGGVLDRLTRELVERSGVALARIWLMRPGDICEVCPLRHECPTFVPCLHLVASAGRSSAGDEDWSRLDGDFRRFPVGVRKVGRAGLGEAICVPDTDRDDRWLARPDWARRESIRGFATHPLCHGGEVLGVLGVFTRAPFEPETFEWLRIVADHASAAIANAQAFEEIGRLRRQLALENEYLREQFDEACDVGELIGGGPACRALQEQVALVAPTDATVLIQGESGTGKELVAREIHRQSPRRGAPMITVNCASIPRELYESEFFGHVKGAFTGAVRDREGRFAAADGGTLFLDEVGEIPLDLQAKLLRVLQERRYERVGEEQTREVDVRILAATNRDLRGEVAAGRFREDLYYRLNVFPVTVVPLRERLCDIEVLARRFAERAARRLGRPPPELTPAAVRTLSGYDWPGNVRELENVIERSVITSPGPRLAVRLPEASAPPTGPAPPPADTGGERTVLTEAELRALERENTLAALRRTRWRIRGPGGAAELLGIRPTTLASRIRTWGLERPV
ncbi:MAG: sigma 54-interacting transcriptional regulator [Myxococcota bacterium]